ncbi:GntR family transcriptional regulator [Dactylosporangium sp. McL0621]|uniref:GntR family transcriptional regulator n=1 Tax=Dactylosporangium sp. McL0621 TaxID=3415678 RepID=UPI003CF76EE4
MSSLHRQVAAHIRAEIRTGSLPPGSILPSEKYLAEAHDVGRATIRDALLILCGEGLVDCRPGYRARVSVPVARMRLTLQPGEEIVARAPSAEEAAGLGLRAGEPVLELRRDGQVELYPGNRTVIGAASPEDWNDPA